MRPKMRAVDHHAIGWAALGRKVGEDSVEDTHAGPANEPVVERLVGATDRGASRHRRPFRITWTIPLTTRRSSTRGMPRVRGKKGFNTLKLSLSQPELIRHRQVLLPRLNHDITSDGIRVCKGLLCGQTGHGTGSSSISVSLP